ncbi:MAG: hypothetical protein GSR81_01860 [Desulfurococcales archaeon]|nr:hypothetical protein [Desulfurococcales archaeon]
MTVTRVVVEADIRPTEDQDKVKQAILNFFDPDTIVVEGSDAHKRMVATAYSLKSLEKFRYLLRTERILDAARKVMRKGTRDNKIVFYIHKQAMFNGRISLVSGDHESPLGAIMITIEHPDPRKVIDWLAPPTVRGRPLFEIDRPPE